MNSKNLTVLSCWLAVTIISVVYLLTFGNKIGDVMFGVFVPIGILVLLAFIVTVVTANGLETGQIKKD